MRPALYLILLTCFACNRSSQTNDAGPNPLAPLPGTGAVTIEMNGTWVVDEVVALEEATNGTMPLTEPPGLMPPAVGTELRIEGDQAVLADTRDLHRDATGHEQVYSWLNHVDGRLALYTRYAVTPAQPNVVDSGSAETLQFALGSVDADTMAGLVQHVISVAFPPLDRPASGLYRVKLRRDHGDRLDERR
ncbi:MAG: hypothetical protein VYE77_10875 [Planctomycetota bacterium]|nr:hypothetical protein [Planctomycetota bacterium]